MRNTRPGCQRRWDRPRLTPGPDGSVAAPVLAAAALCGIDEVYAMGGAQAIFGLAYGTDTIEPVDVIVGPGNAWVQEAKRSVYGTVGIDSYAGPSELMVVAAADTDHARPHSTSVPRQSTGRGRCWSSRRDRRGDDRGDQRRGGRDRRASRNSRRTSRHRSVRSVNDAIDLANALRQSTSSCSTTESRARPEVTTAGCVFVGRDSATAFGDYVAGSNHVLPTGGAGRFSGPLGPAVFRRRITSVHVPAGAAAKLAPHVDRIARAEGFPVHAESAMIRTES